MAKLRNYTSYGVYQEEERTEFPPDLGGDLFLQNSIPGNKISYLEIEKLQAGTISSKEITLDVLGGEGDVYLKMGTVDTDNWTATGGIILGLDDSDGDKEKLFIGNTSSSMDWNVSSADTLTVKGAITATSGAIGGWDVNANNITKNNATLHSDGYLTLGSSNDIVKIDAQDAIYRIWVGHATAGSAPFRVSKAGALTASSATITGALTTSAGSTINGTYVDSLAVSKLSAGTISSQAITLAVNDGSGDSYIAAGKTDFTNSNAGFILGIDDSDSDTVKFYIGDSSNYLNWDGSSLTVVGTIETTAVEIDTDGYVRTDGKTSYSDTDAGFWLGYDTDAYKLNVGDNTNYLKWTGAALEIKGAVYGSSGGFGSDFAKVVIDDSGLIVKKGADIFVEGDTDNPGAITFYNPTEGYEDEYFTIQQDIYSTTRLAFKPSANAVNPQIAFGRTKNSDGYLRDFIIGADYVDDSNIACGRVLCELNKEFTISFAEANCAACTATLAGVGAGNLEEGYYKYVVTFVTAEGETEGNPPGYRLGESDTVEVVDNTSNGQISLSGIPTGTSGCVYARKIYRTVDYNDSDPEDYHLLTTISDNSTTTYTDNTASSSISGAASPSSFNTTGKEVEIKGEGIILSELGDQAGNSDEPSTPSSHHAILFVRDNGSGATQLCIKYDDGSVNVIDTM